MEIVGQGAGERADQVVTPVLPELHVENVDLQHVAGQGAFHRNGPGQDMAGHHALGPRVDIQEFGRDVEFALVRQLVRAAADGIDGDLVAAPDGQDGPKLGFEEAPMAGFGARMQMMMGHDKSFSRGKGSV